METKVKKTTNKIFLIFWVRQGLTLLLCISIYNGKSRIT